MVQKQIAEKCLYFSIHRDPINHLGGGVEKEIIGFLAQLIAWTSMDGLDVKWIEVLLVCSIIRFVSKLNSDHSFSECDDH